MCEWGTTKKLEVTVLANLSYTGERRKKVVDIDSCIFPIVKALNERGIFTVASCCGHGKRPSNIVLEDGREIFIAPNFDTSRELDKAFPPIYTKENSKKYVFLAKHEHLDIGGDFNDGKSKIFTVWGKDYADAEKQVFDFIKQYFEGGYFDEEGLLVEEIGLEAL